MGRKNRTFAEISNFKTIQAYFFELKAIAASVYSYENMPSSVYLPFLKRTLVEKGAIVFFREDVTGELIALPLEGHEKEVDIYGRPRGIRAIGQNGYQSRLLSFDECVVMYDNILHIPILYYIKQFAERLAMCTRIADVNIFNQKTPRIVSTTQEMEQSVKRLMADIDALEERIIVYKNLITDDIDVKLDPVPYVTDKIDMHKEKIFAEFLRFIGIASITEQKKERMIQSEVMASQGGAIASRLQRLNMRRQAIQEINAKFGTNISVKYYDDYFVSERKNELIGQVYKGGNDVQDIDTSADNGGDANDK